MLDGEPRPLDARAVIDDTAAYYQRHTQLALVGRRGHRRRRRALAWNLVSGVNDPAARQRAHGVDRRRTPRAAAVHVRRRPDSRSTGSRLPAEAERERRENLLLVRSSYRQPFGTFSGELPGGVRLAEGYGVMEDHDVWW